MNIGPYMAYSLYIYIFLSIIQKRGFGGPKCCLHASLMFFLDILAIKMADFLKIQSLIFGSATKICFGIFLSKWVVYLDPLKLN